MSQNDEKETYQQQILFAESEALKTEQAFASNSLNEDDLASPNQVILPEAAWQPIDEAFDDDINPTPQTKPNWLLRLTAISFTGVVIYELFDFFIQGFTTSPIITSVYALLFGSIASIASLALFKELRGLAQFKRQNKTQQKANLLLANETNFDSTCFCQKVSSRLPSDAITEQQAIWLESLTDELTEQEIMTLYSRLVLSKVDEQALAQIAKFSTEAVVLVAVSPVAIIDMLVLMWRNLRMIDKIAGLYGMRLGYWSRIKLIKQVFTNMVYAGASEIIADVGVEMLGIETLGRLSTRMAQGLGAGMLTARLGIKTLKLCRPIPFTETAPGITQVRQEVISQVKALLADKVSK
ncbi:YcjF family protein [Thalassomonas sp. M1454]|uniref:YcjF family protein n=1 Tax=Thalassomonas sp. M1454 TaxID=2594477 RepID=UPI00117E03BC|nr:TIGR01620 family protein [Thalassomonas sp. M1454]TRX57244.1 TIGR01620 family protein [Thalassomonas sp. M1454]